MGLDRLIAWMEITSIAMIDGVDQCALHSWDGCTPTGIGTGAGTGSMDGWINGVIAWVSLDIFFLSTRMQTNILMSTINVYIIEQLHG